MSSAAGSRVSGNRGNNNGGNNNTASSNRRSGNNLQRLIELGENEIRRVRRTRATAPRLNDIQRYINRVRRFQARLRRPVHIRPPRSPHRATGPTASGSGRTNSRILRAMITGPSRASGVSNNLLRYIREFRNVRHLYTPSQIRNFAIHQGNPYLAISRASRRRRRLRQNSN
jgi:hypothetical protein